MKTIFSKSKLILCLFMGLSFGAFSQENPPNPQGTFRTVRAILPFSRVETEVQVQIINGKVFYQDDIVLGNESDFSSGRGGAARTLSASRWSRGTIPYKIQAGHPKAALIIRAFDILNTRTNLRLIPQSHEADYIEVIVDNTSPFWSQIGKQGGRQEVGITGSSTGYTDTRFTHKIVHELMHAAGIYHEHTRTDRNNFITVNLSNVIAGPASNPDQFRHNYRVPTSDIVDVGGYNFASLMHYPPRGGFALDPNVDVITCKPAYSSFQNVIGQRDSLSRGDIRAINTIYPRRRRGGAGGDSTNVTIASYLDEARSQDRIDSLMYNVTLIPQPTGVSCWAAAAAMVVNWRDNPRPPLDARAVAAKTGNWGAFYRDGLDANDSRMFRSFALHIEYPQCYSVRGLYEVLLHGPLWVASAEPLAGPSSQDPHARVVKGMYGDGTVDGTFLLICDPWEQGMTAFRANNRGSVYRESFREFTRKMEGLGFRELNEPTPTYIAHP